MLVYKHTETIEYIKYTNADLKISLYVRIHLKIIPWKFHILDKSRFIYREVCVFLKN